MNIYGFELPGALKEKGSMGSLLLGNHSSTCYQQVNLCCPQLLRGPSNTVSVSPKLEAAQFFF